MTVSLLKNHFCTSFQAAFFAVLADPLTHIVVATALIVLILVRNTNDDLTIGYFSRDVLMTAMFAFGS